MKLQGSLEPRLRALEDRHHGSRKVSAYWRAFDAACEKFEQAGLPSNNPNCEDQVPDYLDRLYNNMSGTERRLVLNHIDRLILYMEWGLHKTEDKHRRRPRKVARRHRGKQITA